MTIDNEDSILYLYMAAKYGNRVKHRLLSVTIIHYWQFYSPCIEYACICAPLSSPLINRIVRRIVCAECVYVVYMCMCACVSGCLCVLNILQKENIKCERAENIHSFDENWWFCAFTIIKINADKQIIYSACEETITNEWINQCERRGVLNHLNSLNV